ncbi:MAG: Crp/Fnr family transcriptional regulator [Bdellovibrio sp.]|uniref:Crp/Fnr family transcriptional regulator n=1 Tax=Bdellovibrio sp. TaxID=28201 RepID=UPI0039E6BAC8|nr:Crp/Fnr family transcriptional regulator [Bdellovibrio sp.]
MKQRPTDNCPICSTQEEKITEKIIPLIQRKRYPKNTLIFEQEDSSQGFYLIHKGTVRISKISPAGKEMLIEILGPGKTFGEAGLLGQEKNADSAATSEESEIYYIPKQDFQQILAQNPELYQSVVQSLIRWMDKLHLVIENISLSSAKDRVWSYLCRLQQEQNRPLIHLNGKKHEVAMMLGLRPETFSRTLSDLEAEGLIKMNHKQIQIVNRDQNTI